MSASKYSNESLLLAAVVGSLAGFLFATYGNCTSSKTKKSIEEQDDDCQADDDCKSLFYTKVTGANGSGMPFAQKDQEIEKDLKVVQTDYARLPMSLYSQAVELLPICCVDIICQRKTDNKILLFYRRDKPANDIWWWPGGRLFRGETFFDAAARKIRGETGYKNATVTPVGVVDVWNTFFPTSNWDNDRKPGFEGTQTVNIMVFCIVDDLEVLPSSTDWGVGDHKWVSVSELIQPGKYDKYVILNAQKAIGKGYLRV